MSNKKKTDSVVELTEDLAATHKPFRSDEADVSEALDAQIAQDFETVKKNGYVIIENLLIAPQLERIRDATLPLVFGLAMSTLLTVLVVPLLYYTLARCKWV